MRQIIPTVLPTLVLMGGLCYGQSLGDAARQVRQQKQRDAAVSKRVITSDDLSPDTKPVISITARTENARDKAAFLESSKLL